MLNQKHFFKRGSRIILQKEENVEYPGGYISICDQMRLKILSRTRYDFLSHLFFTLNEIINHAHPLTCAPQLLIKYRASVKLIPLHYLIVLIEVIKV